MGNRNDSMTEMVIEIPLADLYSFKNHPFKVQDDERMLETAESIRNYGVLVPGIVRPRPEGGYEIISGHRRKRASELAGKETMPVIVRNLDDDEAAIMNKCSGEVTMLDLSTVVILFLVPTDQRQVLKRILQALFQRRHTTS